MDDSIWGARTSNQNHLFNIELNIILNFIFIIKMLLFNLLGILIYFNAFHFLWLLTYLLTTRFFVFIYEHVSYIGLCYEKISAWIVNQINNYKKPKK